MDNIGQKVQGEWEKGEAAYRRVGRMLLDQKAALGHGKFEKWFRAQGFGFSLRQAQQYMKLARVSKTHSSAHLNDLHTGNQKLKKATAVKKAMAEPKQLTQKEQAVVQAKEIADLIDYLHPAHQRQGAEGQRRAAKAPPWGAQWSHSRAQTLAHHKH
jgi:hypothetical protein